MMRCNFFVKFLVLCAFVCSLNNKAFAWGKFGHQLVAEVAKYNLSESTLNSINVYLDGTSWEDASTWMDIVRSDPNYAYLRPWHFINIYSDPDLYLVEKKENNLLFRLEEAINNLKNRKNLTNDVVLFNLKVLIHLVGDLHQPLHVGYFKDKGGNLVNVDFFGKSTNLHSVWDSEIIYHNKIRYNDVMKIKETLSKEELENLSTSLDLNKWVAESQSYLPEIYMFSGCTITEEYVDKNAEIIKKQLFLGGIRLSMLLNNIFN